MVLLSPRTSPELTSLHFTLLLSLPFPSLHFTSLHSTSLHSTSLHSTPLHFTSLIFRKVSVLMLFTHEYSNIRPVSFVTSVGSAVLYNVAHSASPHTHFGTAAGRNKGYLSGKLTILYDVMFQ